MDGNILNSRGARVGVVGGPTAKRLLRVIKQGGALFPIFPHGFDGQEDAVSLGITVSATQVRSNGAQLAELARLLESGAVHVAIDGAFPLSDAAAAHQRAAAGHIRGKIVLVVDVPSSDWPPRVVVIDAQRCGSRPSFVRRYHACKPKTIGRERDGELERRSDRCGS